MDLWAGWQIGCIDGLVQDCSNTSALALELLHLHWAIDGLAQHYSNPIVNSLELLQSFTKPSIYQQIESEKMIDNTLKRTF